MNLYWSELLRTVDEFDQLMEMCTASPTQKREKSRDACGSTT